MKIVALSSLSAHHRYVLEKLHQRTPLDMVIQPVWSGRQKSRIAQVLRSPKRQLQTSLSNWRDRRRNRAIAKLLCDSPRETASDLPVTRIPIEEINSEDTAQLIQRHAPDVLLASGCPLLKPRIFELSRLAAINLHWGISPEYRGEDTLFWPLYFRDYDHVGITIHQIDRGIDTGPALARSFLELSPGDSEVSLYVKSARAASVLLPEVLKRMENGFSLAVPSHQSRGKLYLKRQRTLGIGLAYWISCKAGLRPVSTTPAKLEHYLQSGPQGSEACDES